MPDRSLFPQKPRRAGNRYEYLSLVFWPENGFIYIEDKDDNSFITCSRGDWLLRARAFSADATQLADIATRAGNAWKQQTAVQERDAMLALVECMVECARIAKKQGDPTDPKVIKWIQKHAPDRKIQVMAPSKDIIIP